MAAHKEADGWQLGPSAESRRGIIIGRSLEMHQHHAGHLKCGTDPTRRHLLVTASVGMFLVSHPNGGQHSPSDKSVASLGESSNSEALERRWISGGAQWQVKRLLESSKQIRRRLRPLNRSRSAPVASSLSVRFFCAFSLRLRRAYPADVDIWSFSKRPNKNPLDKRRRNGAASDSYVDDAAYWDHQPM